ncbi:fungal specific transcription factor domain-containing protein [Aspergillus mulundensis]|uniref:Transcription factor domain-containing protein n=1 Tax=Aspergillus mulundensis TaxID=1810919 RepID=A0A3D8RR01_9EURO|nr:hypothetical protein DSM5745_06509 [Aspergillus mulundensis]RDW76517.1 hypothetical protein DSM5745_06509 [Aspergillus mulundensis]
MLKVHAEQSAIANSSFSLLSRIQAMLLYAFHALHGESTSRVVHIVGVVMRFAIAHRFHCIRHDGTHETEMKIKAWWCIYMYASLSHESLTSISTAAARLDKVVTITLRIPPYPPAEWIETPPYENKPEPQYFAPWASSRIAGDAEGALYSFDLRYFVHMSKIRQIQSEILSNTRKLAAASVPRYLKEMGAEIDRWAESDRVFANGYASSTCIFVLARLFPLVPDKLDRETHLNSGTQSQGQGQGHASPLGKVYVAHMTRVVLYSSVPFGTASHTADELLQSCCASCATFRALQKRRQIPKHWFDMLFLFQVGVTMLYLVWQRAVPISRALDRAVRDYTVILSIFADRSQHADVYRDCMDVLASGVLRASPAGNIDAELRRDLAFLVCQIEENGLASRTFTMLEEMCRGGNVPEGGDK